MENGRPASPDACTLSHALGWSRGQMMTALGYLLGHGKAIDSWSVAHHRYLWEATK